MNGIRTIDLFGDETLHVHAYRFFMDPSRFCLATAGRRGAKSYTGAKKFWKKVWEEDWPAVQGQPYNPGAARRGTALWHDRRPRLHYWVVADSYELLDEPKRYLLQFLPPELLEHADNSKGRWWLSGDILVEFKTVHNPTGKVGSGLNGMWVEEAARLRDDAWNGFLRPTLADKKGWLIATTTPLGQDWTYRDLYLHALKGTEGYGFHTWKASDNVRAPHVIEEAALAKATMPEEYFRREWEASYEAFIGQIYKEFDESKHIIDALPEGLRFTGVLGGQDWGFGAPGAQEIAGMTPGKDNLPHLWFVDETYSEEELVEEFWIPAAKKAMTQWKFNRRRPSGTRQSQEVSRCRDQRDQARQLRFRQLRRAQKVDSSWRAHTSRSAEKRPCPHHAQEVPAPDRGVQVV